MSPKDIKHAKNFKEDYHVIGVGFGPANIALAIALEEQEMINRSLFFESRAEIAWQPEMMLRGADIQHNPLRDLVTPRNPTSRYGFLSYLKTVGRLYQYLNLDSHYPPRSEYDSYVRWVGEQFNAYTSLGEAVHSICPVVSGGLLTEFDLLTSYGRTFRTRHVVVAPGRTPVIPAPFAHTSGDGRIFHLTRYLSSVSKMDPTEIRRILVVGASQSAAEIMLDLYDRFPDASITCHARGHGLKQKDLSPFTEEIYFPSFVDRYYSLSRPARERVYAELKRSNYGAADPDVLTALNLKMYEDAVRGTPRLVLRFNCDITEVACEADAVTVDFADDWDVVTRGQFDFVVLATGFENYGQTSATRRWHPLLNELRPYLVCDADEDLLVERDFRVCLSRTAPGVSIHLNGLCEATHGFGDAGSFSLLSTRAFAIANSIRRATMEDERRGIAV